MPFHIDRWKIDVNHLFVFVLLLNSPLINRRSIYINITLIFSLGIIDVDLNELYVWLQTSFIRLIYSQTNRVFMLLNYVDRLSIYMYMLGTTLLKRIVLHSWIFNYSIWLPININLTNFDFLLDVMKSIMMKQLNRLTTTHTISCLEVNP